MSETVKGAVLLPAGWSVGRSETGKDRRVEWMDGWMVSLTNSVFNYDCEYDHRVLLCPLVGR